MNLVRYAKKLRREIRETNSDPLVVNYVRARCPLWRRLVGVIVPGVAIRWEEKYKREHQGQLRLAVKRTRSRAIAARG